jgi:AcrR family transcriptional regulator
MATALPFYVSEDDAPAKREILRAALRLFSERGLAATTIRDIAEESGYTNPALYKHFASKEELALHLFETCHRRVWSRLSGAVAGTSGFEDKLDRYVQAWLELVDEHPDVIAFLSDTARELWPKANAAVRRHTVIGIARSLALTAPGAGAAAARNPDIAAAVLQGTLAETARMLQVGVIRGPARRWKAELVAQLRKVVG